MLETITFASGQDGEAPALAMPEEQSLADAFAAFSSAAKSLESSYFGLGQEVARLRQELARERDLRMRREALAEMAAMVAHEVRNPLGSLELFAGLLAESSLPAQEKEWVEQMQCGLRILSATVNNVLEFHGPRPLELAPVEINGVLRSVAAFLGPVAARAEMLLGVDYFPADLWILADRSRLEQVFLNLALNSFRFAAQGGALMLKTSGDDRQVQVCFADNGPGMTLAGLEKILDARLPARADIRGLGLAVVKRIVDQHGGAVGMTSEAGRGASFLLQFPRAGAPQ
jgi:two-component system, sensor histidine kinase FlrB